MSQSQLICTCFRAVDGKLAPLIPAAARKMRDLVPPEVKQMWDSSPPVVRLQPFILFCHLKPVAALAELGLHRQASMGRVAYLSLERQTAGASVPLTPPPEHPCRRVRVCAKAYGTGRSIDSHGG